MPLALSGYKMSWLDALWQREIALDSVVVDVESPAPVRAFAILNLAISLHTVSYMSFASSGGDTSWLDAMWQRQIRHARQGIALVSVVVDVESPTLVRDEANLNLAI
jgi:hypothetical protein